MADERHVPVDAVESTVAPTADGSRPDPATAETEMGEVGRLRATGDGPTPSGSYGRYVVLGRLGAGGMGEVFAAWDPELERRVALKRLRLGTGDEVRESRLLREAQAMARLRHPNVIAVHDVGRLRGEVFIAMEYVQGQTLREWAKQERPWQQVVDAYVQAARGLAAAHAEGLVHRDFKPDNAMIDEAGRVQVLDFGLVGARGEADAPTRPDARAAKSGGPLSSPLTVTGALLGTPAYMSPEQWHGKPADARSDQFALAVALFEALHGHRPFRGDTIPELAARVTEGTVQPESARPIPALLRQTVRRALATDPADRFASLEEFAAKLLEDPARSRRRRIVASGLVLGCATAGALSWWVVQAGQRRCADASASIQAVWNEDRREQVARVFASSPLDYADDTWAAAAAVLDKRAAALAEAYAEACRATHVSQVQSGEALDRRRLCLDGHVRELDAVLEVLSSGEAVVIENAVAAAEAVGDGAACTAERAVLESSGAVPPPSEAAVALQDEIAKANATRVAGQTQRAAEIMQAELERARELDDPRTLVDALLETAATARDLGQLDEADALVHEAYVLVRELDVDASLFLALRERIALAIERDRFAEARRLCELMQAEMRRAGREDLMPDVDAQIGLVEQSLGHYDVAVEHYERAVAAYDARGLGDSTAALNARGNWGSALLHAGKPDEARALIEAVRDTASARFGSTHPIVSGSILNLGTVASAQGDLEEARSLFEEALRVRRVTLGPRSGRTAEAQERLATILMRMGHPAEAEPLFREALQTLIDVHGEQHSWVSLVLNNLAAALWYQGKLEEALEVSQRSYRIKKAVLGEDHPDSTLTRGNIGLLYIALGHTDAARDAWDAVRRYHAARGDDEEVARADAAIAYTFALDGEHARARAIATRLLASGDAPPRVEQFARAALAEAARDEPATAARLAREAIDAIEDKNDFAWLIDHLQQHIDRSR